MRHLEVLLCRPEVHLERPRVWSLLMQVEVTLGDGLGREALLLVVEPVDFLSLAVAKHLLRARGEDGAVDDLYVCEALGQNEPAWSRTRQPGAERGLRGARDGRLETHDESDVDALLAVLARDGLQGTALGRQTVCLDENPETSERTWLRARSPCFPAANAPKASLPLHADVAPVIMSEPPLSSSLPGAVKAFTAACEKAVAATMLVFTDKLMLC